MAKRKQGTKAQRKTAAAALRRGRNIAKAIRRTLVYPESLVIRPGRDLRGHRRRSACVLDDSGRPNR